MSLKKGILDRYECSDDGRIIIDASVRSIEELYSNFERDAPYLKRDLDQEFVDWLTDSAAELGPHDFTIRISLPACPDPAVMDRVRNSIRTFYEYLRQLELDALRTMLRRSIILFVIGLVLLALAIRLAQHFADSPGVTPQVFVQGLTVAAWVSLWEAIANIFLEWRPHQKKINLCARIRNAPVIFRATS